MYAIVETGGKQYRVKPGDTVAVERLPGEPGSTFDLGRVLLVAGNGKSEPRVGSPGVEGAIVRAEVVEHMRGEKIIVFRYKSKVRYRRKTGHRQSLTRLRITDILLDGNSSLSAPESVASPPLSTPTQPSGPHAEALARQEPTIVSEETAATPVELSTPGEPSGPHAEALARQEPITVAEDTLVARSVEMPASVGEDGATPDAHTQSASTSEEPGTSPGAY